MPASSVAVPVDTNDVLTFTIVATGAGQVPFNPANDRLFLRFETPDGNPKAQTLGSQRSQRPILNTLTTKTKCASRSYLFSQRSSHFEVKSRSGHGVG